MMNEQHAGFIMNFKQPTCDGYVACMVVTPKLKGGDANLSAKMERNLGRSKAIDLALQLLEACDAPDEILAQIRALDDVTP